MKRTNSKWMIPSIAATLALCLACTCCVIIGLYFYGDQILETLRGPQETNVEVTQVPTEVVNTDDGLPEWTVIVYSAADDVVLEENMWFDVNEMELVGSTPEMNIVVQIDRYSEAFTGDGDWTDARRYLITQDNDLSRLASPVVQSLGEVDMGNSQTLIDFVTWSMENYPAKKYALIMSDHGGGWTGGFSDMSAGESSLTMTEIASSLEQILQARGVDKFEFIGFDACLMAQIEVFGTLYPYSNYMVASEEVIPAYGWSYAGWLGELAKNPTMDGSGAAQAIVSTYVITDTFLTEVRATPDEISQEEATTTLSAVESARIPDVIGAMNQFVSAAAFIDQSAVAEARTYTRSYLSLFGDDTAPSFIDLGNFSQVLSGLTDDTQVQQAAVQLQTAIDSAVVAEKHGANMSGSNGIAFHFPDSDIYYFTEFNSEFPPYYAESADKFLEQSVWDEFLAYHYTGEEFAPQDGQTTTPSRSATIVAPGASEMNIAPIQISDTDISGDEIVTVSTMVEGNVAYIHTALYFWDEATQSYWIGDVSYYIAENTTTVDGVNMPDYGDSPIQVEYEWSPSLYALTDGQHDAFVLLEPYEYLSTDGETIYTVYGQYTEGVSGTAVEASLFFDADGNFLYAYGYPDSDDNGASSPVEITPQIGDTFSDYVQYYTYDANDEPIYNYDLSDDVFTWGEEGFSFYTSYPADGDYAVGIIAYDFDNNFVANFETFTYTR
jgi:hypothetical protein